MDFNAYGKLNVILWEEFSYGKINVILWEKKCYAFLNAFTLVLTFKSLSNIYRTLNLGILPTFLLAFCLNANKKLKA